MNDIVRALDGLAVDVPPISGLGLSGGAKWPAGSWLLICTASTIKDTRYRCAARERWWRSPGIVGYSLCVTCVLWMVSCMLLIGLTIMTMMKGGR